MVFDQLKDFSSLFNSILSDVSDNLNFLGHETIL